MESNALNEAIRHLSWIIRDATIENLADITFTSEDQARYGEILTGREYDPEDYYFHSLAWGLLRSRARGRESLCRRVDDAIEALLCGDERRVDTARRQIETLLRAPFPAAPTKAQRASLSRALSALGRGLNEANYG